MLLVRHGGDSRVRGKLRAAPVWWRREPSRAPFPWAFAKEAAALGDGPRAFAMEAVGRVVLVGWTHEAPIDAHQQGERLPARRIRAVCCWGCALVQAGAGPGRPQCRLHFLPAAGRVPRHGGPPSQVRSVVVPLPRCPSWVEGLPSAWTAAPCTSSPTRALPLGARSPPTLHSSLDMTRTKSSGARPQQGHQPALRMARGVVLSSVGCRGVWGAGRCWWGCGT